MPLCRGKQRYTRKVSRKDQSLMRLENFKKDVVTDAHQIPLDELCLRLNTDPVTGLSPDQAKNILLKTGPNILTPSKKTPEIVKFIRTLTHGFSMLLWIGAFLCFLSVLIVYLVNEEYESDNVVLGSVLVIVVVVTGVFMYIQDRKSQGLMASFANMIPPKAIVIRGGRTMSIISRDVVIGDLVDIKFGDRIPADIRIIHSQGLKVDNSALTGESEPQARGEYPTDKNFLETKNIIFFSTSAVEGTGRGIVVACGDQTVMGRIAGLTTRLKPNMSPMAKELNHFMKIISSWACFLGVAFGSTALCLNYGLIDTLLFVIGIIVANVPEGLLATVTVCLTVTAKRMAKKNCMIKNLDAVETLGSTSVICSDKTGTLTQNKMTVSHLWFNNETIVADITPEQKMGKSYNTRPDFLALSRCATLCSRAEFLPDQKKVPINFRKVLGDASEAAILKFFEATTKSVSDYRNKNRKLVEIPFSSATKYQTSVHLLESETCMVVMKGAPERILERCNRILYNNEIVEFNDELRRICDNACTQLAENGERVLGFCDLELDSRYTKKSVFTTEPPNFPQRGMRFVGFISLIDPPRAQVPDAVRTCQTAGIKITMVTGDHPITAKAIAQKVGIITESNIIDVNSVSVVEKLTSSEGKALVIHGSVLKDLPNVDLDEVLYNYKEIVFARTSPTQKLQIVEGYQRLGEIVAVTGDGVNDAPALRKSDIGIAMGITGTEVSQQAADMILLDDNFASIITGVEEGRRIFDNLKKSITYTLASNVPEILPFLFHVIFNIPLPLGVIAILCIDLLTDMLPAISLAYEKAESDIMLRPPRNPKRDKLVNRKLYFLAYGHIGLMEAFGGFLVYFIVMAEHGFMPQQLLGIREDWNANWVNDLKDSYGQEWSYAERMVLEGTCYSAFMVSVIVTQWADLIVCKTRINSIFEQGMGNMVLNVSIVVETVLAAMLVYLPYMHHFKFYPVSYRWWLYAVPFGIFIFAFDEFRKWHIRKYPKGWYQRETFY